MQNTPPSPTPPSGQSSLKQNPRPSEREYQRAYKACIPCRKRKAKCDISGGSDRAEGPPCARCRREHRQCVFTAERSWNPRKRQKTELDSSGYIPGEATKEGGPEGSGLRPGHYLDMSSDTLSSSPTEPLQLMKPSSLDESVMGTVVSRGNDALNILIEAASHQERSAPNEAIRSISRPSRIGATTHASIKPHINKLSSASAETIKLWSGCRLVRQGWLSALEAITYVDLFFEHMSPLSPITRNWYGQHKNHHHLLAEEPTLCCTILTVSSRHHILPGLGGMSRGTLIHDRIWSTTKDLLIRTIFGQEKGVDPKTRNIGTVEALLLLTEWYPRSLHFPPDTQRQPTNSKETEKLPIHRMDRECRRAGAALGQNVVDVARTRRNAFT